MGERAQAPSTVHGPSTVNDGGGGGEGDGGGGEGGGEGEGDGGGGLGDGGGGLGDGGSDGGDGGGGGGAACAQTTHPAPVTLPSEDHVKALPSNTLLGPIVPLYVAPFTINLSQQLSVLKAVALKS